METTASKKIKVNDAGIRFFHAYVKDFANVNIRVESRTFGKLLQYHWENIFDKILTAAQKMQRRKKQEITISFNFAEINVLCFMLDKMPASGMMLVIQQQILDGLTLE